MPFASPALRFTETTIESVAELYVADDAAEALTVQVVVLVLVLLVRT